MKLLTSQKNRLFEIINIHNLSPALFIYSVKRENGKEYVAITHDNKSEFYFNIRDPKFTSKNYDISFAPGEGVFHEHEDTFHWSSVEDDFDYWLRNLKREIEVPDKWAELEEMVSKTSLMPNREDGSRFSAQEYKLLEAKIAELKAGVSKLSLQEPQIEILNNKLDKLLEHAVEMEKFDWQNLFIGYIVSFAMDQGLQQVNLHALMQLIKQVFSGMLFLGS